MWEFITSNLAALFTTFSLGSLGGIATIKWTQRSAQATAMKQFQEIYQTSIADLQKDKDMLKQELYDLRRTVELHYQEIKDLKTFECIRMDCQFREQRPIKLTELIYEKNRQDNNSL